MAERACLHCGETPSSLRREGITLCGIEGGYEYRELEHEFAHHRWADWRDRELDLMGVRPEAYDKHRRTPILQMQWIGCADTKRGHVLITEKTYNDGWAGAIGSCMLCGWNPARFESTTGLLDDDLRRKLSS